MKVCVGRHRMAESQAVRISDSKICAAKRVLKQNVVKGGKREVEVRVVPGAAARHQVSINGFVIELRMVRFYVLHQTVEKPGLAVHGSHPFSFGSKTFSLSASLS